MYLQLKIIPLDGNVRISTPYQQEIISSAPSSYITSNSQLLTDSKVYVSEHFINSGQKITAETFSKENYTDEALKKYSY